MTTSPTPSLTAKFIDEGLQPEGEEDEPKLLSSGINNEKEETKVPGTTVSTDEGKSEASTKSESKAEEEVEVTQQEQ